ncbi:hypothetical protein [Actinacidiphila sp. ITFR-21]|uniref:hypothetical protein n=1 Tax=Actinacidiphila sp. ITFR-21 TaxID=3075199 RepID=UPI00288AF54A|nr:hypothetical protein [Streptomyces sp. ITFR-21]WNI20349.1 hypothetical protein RLT57_32620 [Streptomyces sp. ITFR-21]
MTDDLTKWPRLLVTGTPVTREQADEILIRTTNLYLLDVNDKAWVSVVYRAFGLAPGRYGNATIDSIRAVSAELDTVPLTLLYNSRVASSWIGGPHGWCNWNGQIGCSTYNLGKWPDRETVISEWQSIAVAFPFLDLTAQLLADEGQGPVLGQWRVVNGRATEEPIGLPVTPPVELDEWDVIGRVMFVGGEQGVPLARLTAAVQRVRAARAALH